MLFRSVGRIDNSGNVYTGTFGGTYKGSVDSNGYVYAPGLLSKGSIVGRINPDGRVFTGSFGGAYIGRVDTSGNVYDNSGLFGGSIIGRAEHPKRLEGGAAYLLLLR